VGDALLQAFVRRLRARVRVSDALFRWGGEEFAVLATGIGYRGGAVLAENLREAIADQPFATVGSITASVGVAEFLGCENAEAWFSRADQALYAAKHAGRNRVQVCREGISDRAPDQVHVGVLRLSWQEAYESGEPMIDAEHRQLFELGNVLIATAIKQGSASGSWPVQVALDSLLAHVARHFQHEEKVLAGRDYPGLIAHKEAHATLLRRAAELRAAIASDPQALGTLVNFIAQDLISQHIRKVDRLFFPLF